MKQELYYVIYRTGGTQNVQWHRTLAMFKVEAEQARAEVERGGRKAIVVNKSLSDAIGLPTGYEYTKRID